MNLGIYGTVITGLGILLFAIGSLVTVRVKWLSREARDKRELREVNIEAFGYIYDLERALQEASHALGRKIVVEKPEILKSSYLEKKGESNASNAVLEMAEIVKKLHQDGKNVINGSSE